MNVDFEILSSAVQQANSNQIAASDLRATDSPRKIPSRRRSSKAGSSNALQFLEAAQMSWNFAQEDLPRETTALQRRKSIRSGDAHQSKGALAEVGHKSWTFGENRKNEPGLTLTGSSKTLPPRSKSFALLRRPTTIKEEPSQEDEASVVNGQKGGSARMARRSSIQSFSVEKEEPVQQAEAPTVRKGGRLARRSSIQTGKPVRAEPQVDSPPQTPTAAGGQPKMMRRNTIQHCTSTSMDDSAGSLTRSPKQSRRCTIINQMGKGNVRFELDHKNRIKRRVSYIRAQNAKTDASKLWWSEEELERIYERENRVYEKFAESKSYKRKIQRLWGSCSKASGSSSKPPSPETLGHVAGAPCRGLEVDILETVRDRRARVIGSVLDAQGTLQEFEPIIRAKVLSARYKNLCKAATRFARKMGEGDALEAANVYSN